MNKIKFDSLSLRDNKHFKCEEQGLSLNPDYCGPEEIIAIDDTKSTYRAIIHFNNRQRHSDNGPAFQFIANYMLAWASLKDVYFKHGKCHNLNGFAVVNYKTTITFMGPLNEIDSGEYWIEGVRLSEEEFVAQGGTLQKEESHKESSLRLRTVNKYVQALDFESINLIKDSFPL